MPGSHRQGAQKTSVPGEGSEGQAATFPSEQWEERGQGSALEAAPSSSSSVPCSTGGCTQQMWQGGDSGEEMAADIQGTSHSQRRQTCSQDGLAFTVTPIQLGDIWGRGCGHHSSKPGGESCCDPFPAAGHQAGTGSTWEISAWITISRPQWLEMWNAWIYTHTYTGLCRAG